MSNTVKTDQVWVSRSKETRTPSRRVIQVINGLICYSIGGDRTRWCKSRAFNLWIARHKAIVTRAYRPRSLTLRAETRV